MRQTALILLNVGMAIAVIFFMIIFPMLTEQRDRNELQLATTSLCFLATALIVSLCLTFASLQGNRQALRAAKAQGALISKTEAILHQVFCICFDDTSFPDARRYAPWRQQLLELNGGMNKIMELVQNGTLPQLPKPGVLPLRDSQKAALYQLFSSNDVR